VFRRIKYGIAVARGSPLRKRINQALQDRDTDGGYKDTSGSRRRSDTVRDAPVGCSRMAWTRETRNVAMPDETTRAVATEPGGDSVPAALLKPLIRA